jgi:cyclophilin family peptidyl-prolyl cis-trans isomerase
VSAEIRHQLRQQAEQEQFTDFTTRFSNRWRSRTVCLPPYAIKDCSNGPALNEPSRSGGSETATGEGNSSDSAACSEHTESPAGAKSYPCPDLGETVPDGSTATVKTNYGTFTIELATEEAPLTSTSFAYLAEKGFYDGLTFHRIVPGFVIQGGDPLGDGTGGPGYSVVEKPPKSLTYSRGVVAMAKSSGEPAGTSGSQFFVVTGSDAGLPPEYALLGRVGQGMGVVSKIGKLPTAGEKPKERVVMEEVTIGRG